MRVGFSLCLFLLGWFCWPHQASAYKFKYTPDTGRIYHWKRNKLPVQLFLDQAGSPGLSFVTIQKAMNEGVNAWNSVGCSVPALLKMQGTKQSVNAPARDGVNLIQFVKDANLWKFPATQLAVTVHYFDLSTGEIVETDLVFNNWNFQWGLNGEGNKYDIQATATHELGHVLGLGHSKDTNACMFASASPGEVSKRKLNEDDRKGICNLYPQQSCTEGKEEGTGLFCYNGRVTQVCPAYNKVCQPCRLNEDCRGDKNFCLNLKEGTFCGHDCSKTKTCPDGYSCRPIEDAKKVTIGFNCVPTLNQCTGAKPFPCCQNNEQCLAPYKCINSQCRRGTVCVQEGKTCSQNDPCCTGMGCIDDGTGARCRKPCDPLAPRCSGSLRCAFADPNNLSVGYCVPPNNGGGEGASCSDQKTCEHELQCHPKDNLCRYVCRPEQSGVCPSGYRCIPLSSGKIGLCEKDSGGKACNNFSQCATGQVCRNGQCAPCKDKSECPAQHECRDGACLSRCQDTSTCPRQHICTNGLCVPGTNCTVDKDCGRGLVCKEGTCRPTSGETKCSNDANCPAGQKCTNGKCLDPCNNTCSAAEKCFEGRCVPKTCTSDAQCGQGLVCKASVCAKGTTDCGGKGPCPSGTACSENKCKGEVGYGCAGDSDCVSGLCVSSGKQQFCSKSCSVTDAKSCPGQYFCTEFPNIGVACWPAQYTKCKDGKCQPLQEGCSCNTAENAPTSGVLFVLLLLFFLQLRQRVQRQRREHA